MIYTQYANDSRPRQKVMPLGGALQGTHRYCTTLHTNGYRRSITVGPRCRSVNGYQQLQNHRGHEVEVL